MSAASIENTGPAENAGPTQPESVIIVGASLAGVWAARGLRAQGFTGTLTIVGEELHRPYDRPPLSKDFLRSLEALHEPLEAEDEDLGASWLLGVRATSLRPRETGGADITLDDGREIGADAVIIATGARARRLPGVDLPGVHLLRTADDALALRNDLHTVLHTGAEVAIVGGGFIGSEVAATARELGCSVTMIVMEDAPLRLPLGPYADVIAALHVAQGVTIRANTVVRTIEPTGDGTLDVVLSDGDRISAGTVVVGIGAIPCVDWLHDSGLDLGERGTGAVRCDAYGATNLLGVYAVGDCAAWFEPALGQHHVTEHWTSAKERGGVVAAHLLGADRIPTQRPPFVWSDIYGKRLQLAGHRELADHPDDPAVTIEAGSLAEGSFAAVYRCGGEAVAVLAFDQSRYFAGIRRRLKTPVPANVGGASE